MGLAERRALDQMKQNDVDRWIKEIETAAGSPVPVEIHWDSFAKLNGNTDSYPTWFQKVYVTPLKDALAAIAVDAMGKEAVKNGLKKIVIDGSAGISPANFTFVNGELMLKHLMDTNVDEVRQRGEAIRKLLEAKL